MDKRMDDLGDDVQEQEIALLRKYEDDPPADLVIEETEGGGEVGISRWLEEESERGDVDSDDRPAEEAAMHTESRRQRRFD